MEIKIYRSKVCADIVNISSQVSSRYKKWTAVHIFYDPRHLFIITSLNRRGFQGKIEAANSSNLSAHSGTNMDTTWVVEKLSVSSLLSEHISAQITSPLLSQPGTFTGNYSECRHLQQKVLLFYASL